MEIIEIDGLEFRVIRSQRRTLCIRIADDGAAEILAPRKTGKKEICDIVKPYMGKLMKQREQKLKSLEASASFVLTYGSEVRFLGSKRTVREGVKDRIGYDQSSFFVPAGLGGKEMRDAVVQVYKLAAKDYLKVRVAELSALLGLEVKAVKINSATSHWASCSRKDTLNFSWFSIMAAPDTVDYLIIHELCHMYEFNHSKRFWELVSEYCPEHKNHRAKLKALWREIECENWK